LPAAVLCGGQSPPFQGLTNSAFAPRAKEELALPGKASFMPKSQRPKKKPATLPSQAKPLYLILRAFSPMFSTFCLTFERKAYFNLPY
jgi:hypothetical protein